MANLITILIADDHPIVRQGLRQIIGEDKSLLIIAAVCDGREALAAIEELKPQVTVLDVDMPVMSGFDVVRSVRKKALETEIIFLTMHRDENLFNEAMDLGAKGFVFKDSALADIVACIKAVAANQHYTSQALASFLMKRNRQATGLTEKRLTIKDLTPTERRVLKFISENLSSKEISEELSVSTGTVEKHRAHICRKLNLHGNNILLRFAIQHKSELS